MAKSRVEKTRNGNTWTEARYFQQIRSALRNAFRYYKPFQEALEKSSRPSQSLNKRLKKEYQCAHCLKWFKRSDIEIDHIQECGSLNSYEDIVPFIKRLAVEDSSLLQILCKEDHKIKTKSYLQRKK
jgi:5-methylcytosine-specific restriction endonuclease McrA